MTNAARQIPRGPFVLAIEGLELTSGDRDRLLHPIVGGVILFARNFATHAQLRALTASIAALRNPRLVIAVDHEGGRVQRFQEGFTAIPPMRTLGELWDRDPGAASADAFRLGRTIGNELSACGIDFSFTPVLDLDYGESAIIGDRAFHRDPVAVVELAGALVKGLHAAGMAAVGKHFPGHGFVAADSHVALPSDPRSLGEIEAADLVPFAKLCAQGLDGVMPAHVVYPAVDGDPAGYSRLWLQRILRERLCFDGMIFSDDLEMVGALGAGSIGDRAEAAVTAGCDTVLVCNDPNAMGQLLDGWRPPARAELARRYLRMERGLEG